MNQIDGPRDESIKEPEQLLMQCARVPAFDAMCPDQERLAMEFCQEISGLKGKPGRMPDPVRLLEMAEALYLAECGADCSNPSSISQGCSARRALQARSQIKYLERHIAEPAPVISQSEALVRYCPGCGSIGTVEEKYLDCCPDGIEARMIPQALAQKCRDTFKMAVDGLLALPQEAAPVAVAVPTKVIEALEMLESGALNVAMNAKNRGDGYDEGYANAMAKMARKTLDALAATTAADAPTTAEKSEMLELILALQAFIGFAESNGEIVFAGGGMQAIEEINSCTKAARTAIAKVEGSK